MDLVKVTIPNWGKYNERQDRKNYVWFRFQNTFFTDQNLFGLSEKERFFFIFLLCEASKCTSEIVNLRVSYAAHLLETSSKDIHERLQALAKSAVICLEMPGNARQCQELAVLQTDRQTDMIDKKIVEEIYKKYPRKEGKKKGLEKITRENLSLEDLKQLGAAVDRFVAHHVKLRTEPKFIPHFSTFVSSWRDWLEPDAGQTTLGTETIRPKKLEDFL